jgi:hypothetical protein
MSNMVDHRGCYLYLWIVTSGATIVLLILGCKMAVPSVYKIRSSFVSLFNYTLVIVLPDSAVEAGTSLGKTLRQDNSIAIL